MSMPDSIPVVSLGAEALEALLNYNSTAAVAQLQLLTMSDLVALASAAGQLAGLARRFLNRTCGRCATPIVWDANLPTQQQPRWRHVDQDASSAAGAHDAYPDPNRGSERS